MKKLLLDIIAIMVLGLVLLAVVGSLCVPRPLLQGATGDLRLRAPPLPNSVKLAEVRPAVELIVSSAVTRAIQREPRTAENVSGYLREVGRVFASVETNANFSVEHVTGAIAKLPTPLATDDSYERDVANLIMSIYKLAYADRMQAEKSPVEWLTNICILFKNAIDNGLKNAGRVGIHVP